MSHLIRLCDWNLLEPSLDLVHNRIKSAVLEIAGIPASNQHAAMQLELPVSRGGLGITRLDQPAADAGRLSAAALAQAAFTQGSDAFQPLTGPSVERFAPLLARLKVQQPDVWPEGMQAAPGGLNAAEVSAAWKAHSQKLRLELHDELMRLLALTPRGRKEVARLRSCSAPEAGAWVDALPITIHLRMRDLEVRTSLKHMLGHSTLPPIAPVFPCECGAQVSHGNHDHAMCCQKIARDKTLRHDAIVISVRRSVTRAGLASTLEPKVYPIGGGAANPDDERMKARGDILIITDEGRKVLDVSVIHAAAESYYARAAAADGAAAALREGEKTVQYARQGDQGFAFWPFVLESYGRLGKKAWDVINALASLAAERGNVSKRAFKRSLLQEVSVALCCGNAAVYAHGHACQARARGLGRRFRRGLRVPTADLRLG
jgi:hypothetical protein